MVNLKSKFIFLIQQSATRPQPEIQRLTKTVSKLEEKFRALNSAIKLYSFAGNIRTFHPHQMTLIIRWCSWS